MTVVIYPFRYISYTCFTIGLCLSAEITKIKIYTYSFYICNLNVRIFFLLIHYILFDIFLYKCYLHLKKEGYFDLRKRGFKD